MSVCANDTNATTQAYQPFADSASLKFGLLLAEAKMAELRTSSNPLPDLVNKLPDVVANPKS